VLACGWLDTEVRLLNAVVRCAAATTTYCSFISLSSLKQEIIRQSYANSETVELEVVDAQTKEGAVLRCKSLNHLRC
jgi:hypothetical protein